MSMCVRKLERQLKENRVIMLKELEKRNGQRKRRQLRVRKRLKGTALRPRFSVCKTNCHLHAQIINDEEGKTLVSLSTASKELRGSAFGKKSTAAAAHIGAELAKRAKEKNIQKVVFDRGRYKYHGLLARAADAAREGGLQF